MEHPGVGEPVGRQEKPLTDMDQIAGGKMASKAALVEGAT
jgi:hypothetical protein